ncbi:ABC transporter ATP-binding protein [Streptomyces xiaopingdaonensis]|uniref:ABC transporter ATP-binding protein n=1 Tax=Streptomyces xiaopingdaonensis TaxID=1565415 RepID=UPI0002FDF34B|nr:ABC transporter ATP-binding protein [Streptomyces xiaopingdaonensis]
MGPPVQLLRNRAARWLTILSLLRHVPAGAAITSLLLNIVLGLLPISFVVGMSILLQRVPAAEAAGGGSPEWSALLLVLVLSGLAFGLQQSLMAFQEATGEVVMRHVDRHCRNELMHAALSEAPAVALDNPAMLDRLTVAREAFDRTSASPGDAAAGALALVARYTQLLAAAVLVGYAVSPVAAVVIGLTALTIRYGQRGSLGRFGDFYDGLASMKRRATYVKYLGSGVQAAKETRLLGLLGWLLARHTAEHRAYLTTMWRGRRRLLGPPFLVLSAVGLTGATVVVGMLAQNAVEGSMSLLHLGIALQALLILIRFGVYFPEADVQTQYGSLAYQALRSFRDGSRALAERKTAVGNASADGLPGEAIRFHGVSFRYRDDAPPVLDALDLELPAGTSTAVVGVNGAGKTTLVKLLTGLFAPTTGHLSVDGRDLATLAPEEWHRRLAVIFQDYVRYELSAADNIGMGAPHAPADDSELLAAARRAGATEALAALPDGLRTVLSRQYEGGRDLSGGQWQRIALARALHAVHTGASVMILDEPTAQLDVRAEVEFFDRFLEITRGLTTVVISHRFSTVRRADRIVVIDGGRVVEQGTHDELLAADGQYARLFHLQAERFADEPSPAHHPTPTTDVVS